MCRTFVLQIFICWSVESGHRGPAGLVRQTAPQDTSLQVSCPFSMHSTEMFLAMEALAVKQCTVNVCPWAAFPSVDSGWGHSLNSNVANSSLGVRSLSPYLVLPVSCWPPWDWSEGRLCGNSCSHLLVSWLGTITKVCPLLCRVFEQPFLTLGSFISSSLLTLTCCDCM